MKWNYVDFIIPFDSKIIYTSGFADYQVIIYPNNSTCKVTSIPVSDQYLSWDVKPGSTANNVEMAATNDLLQNERVSYQGRVGFCDFN